MQEMVARENHLGRGKSQRAGKETGNRSLKKPRGKEVYHPAEPCREELRGASASPDSTEAGSSTWDLDGNSARWWFSDCWCS